MKFSDVRNAALRLETEREPSTEERLAVRRLLEPYSKQGTQLAEGRSIPDVDALVEIDDTEGRNLIMQIREIYHAALEGEADAVTPRKGFQPDPRLD